MSPLVRCVGLFVGLGLSSCVFVVSDGEVRMGGGTRGSGVRSEETRVVEDFHAVRLQAPARVHVRVGEARSIRVAGDDNVVPEVRTRVSNGTLIVELEGSWRLRDELELTLSLPTLESFRIEGSGSVSIDGVQAERLELAIEGSGALTARGSVRELRATIEGSGELDLDELQAKQAELSIEGSGAIEAAVSEGLHYTIEGSGSIAYSGTATSHGSVEGSGALVRRD